MKKAFITSAFIVTFVGYSLYQYFGMSSSVSYVAPVTSETKNTSLPKQVAVASQPVIPTKSTPVSKTPTPTPVPVPTPVKKTSLYADGTYTGSVADAYYGNIQVQATIQNGQITNVTFLQHPGDRGTSVYINGQADPILASEAISAQSANVNIVSGATDSSRAFIQSLGAALTKAKNA